MLFKVFMLFCVGLVAPLTSWDFSDTSSKAMNHDLGFYNLH